MRPLATKCVRGKGSSSAVLSMSAEALRVGVRWRMPPLATKCVRGKGSSGVQAPRSASQVNVCTKKQNVDESLRLLDVMRATCIPPSNDVDASVLVAQYIDARSCFPTVRPSSR